jgi:hypothetical protein
MHRTIAVALALAAAPLHAQPSAAERMATPPLSGFVEGFAQANPDQSIREEIPAGEAVERWTRMVTTQRFTGLAERISPVGYLANILGHVPGSCPGAQTTRPVVLTVSGRQAAQFEVDCPRNAGGQPETFILLAVAGARDMHVKQVAWRGGTTPKGLAWGREFLAKVALCRSDAPCRR